MNHSVTKQDCPERSQITAGPELNTMMKRLQVQRHNWQIEMSNSFLTHWEQSNLYRIICIIPLVLLIDKDAESGAGIWYSAFRPNMVFISLPGDYQDRNTPRSLLLHILFTVLYLAQAL